MLLPRWRKAPEHITPDANPPRRATLAHIHTRTEFDELCGWPLVFLFKSSPRCAISFFAQREIASFCGERPDAAVRVIDVLRSRELSVYAASRMRVQHESPQLIVLRQGIVVATASHDAITSKWLTSCV